ncbi:MAG: PmoA family protein [Pirellulales bacterium]|nr:PmoA family protein [Pirellulales bacterium]
MSRAILFTACVLLTFPCASAADTKISFTVEAGSHARHHVPIRVPVVLPLDLADVNKLSVTVTGPDGKTLPGQLVEPSPIRADSGPEVQEGQVLRELWFVLPELAQGKTATFSATISPENDAATKQAAQFAWHDRPSESNELQLGTRPVLRYMYRPLDNSSPQTREQTYKIFHHVFDPADGSRIVTKGPGGLYTHHRGLFYGFNKVTYGDGKHADVWHAKGDAHQSHEGVEQAATGPVLGRHDLKIDWHGERGEVFAREQRELTAYAVPGGTLIDFTSRLAPVLGPVKLDGDPQHAGFHFRADNEVAETTKSQTYYVRPDGQGKPGETRNWPDQRDHVNLPWNALSFVLGDERYTACILDQPTNPKEARFSERDYGRFGSYFEYDVTEEHPLVVRYRVWLQRGEMTPEQVAALSADFVEPPTVKVL